MTSIDKRRAAGIAFGLVSLVATHASRADMTYFVNQTSSIDFSDRNVDFTTSSIPTNGSGVTAGLKMWRVQLATNDGRSQCLELRTAGDGTGDTRFWVYDSNLGDYRSLNDDSNGTLYSTARVWLVPPSGVYEYADVYVTGYSSAYNAMKFSVSIWKYSTSMTEAQCTQGSTMKHIRGTQTLVNPT